MCRSFQATAFIFYQKLFSLSRTFLTFFKAIWLLFSNKLIYIIISFFVCQEFFQFFFFAVSHESALIVYHFRFRLSRTFLKYFYFSQPLLPQWIFILTRFFISVNMFSYLFLCSFGWAKKKNLDVAKISFLHFINKNGERGI